MYDGTAIGSNESEIRIALRRLSHQSEDVRPDAWRKPKSQAVEAIEDRGQSGKCTGTPCTDEYTERSRERGIGRQSNRDPRQVEKPWQVVATVSAGLDFADYGGRNEHLSVEPRNQIEVSELMQVLER